MNFLKESPLELPTLEQRHDALVNRDVASAIDEWILGWLYHSELRNRGARPPGALLLFGPPGCGKTTLAGCIAGKICPQWTYAFCAEGHHLMSSYVGSTGHRLTEAFALCAQRHALLFLEEIDSLAETRSSTGSSAGQENNRITIALMRLIEGATFPVIASTNRQEALDPALLRRFETKVMVSEPTPKQRQAILERFINPVPEALLALNLADAVPAARRLQRAAILKEITESGPTRK